MSIEEPRHGTVSGYNHDRCRCEACRRAAMHRQERYRSRAGYHNSRITKPILVPAAVVVDHIEALHTSGWAYAHIAAEIGMDRMNFRHLRKRARTVHPDTAARILAVQPLTPVPIDEVVVDRLIAGADWRAINATMRERETALLRIRDAGAFVPNGENPRDYGIESLADARKRLGINLERTIARAAA